MRKDGRRIATGSVLSDAPLGPLWPPPPSQIDNTGGDLLYEDTTFDSDITAKMGEMMRFDPHSFLQSKLKLSDMARESCLSLTVYLCKLKGHHPATTTADGGGDGVGSHSAVKDDAFEMMLPLAFARFPMIDERNLLRDGKYTLHLWPLPIYLAEVHCVGLFG